MYSIIYTSFFRVMFGFFTGGQIFFSRMRAKIEVLKLLTGEAEKEGECVVLYCVSTAERSSELTPAEKRAREREWLTLERLPILT